MSYAVIVKPRKGNFAKNYDTFNKMDPYLNITLGDSAQKTDVASGQGKTPVWTKALTFPLTATQFNSLNDLTILFEAYDDDFGNDEFIGKIAVKVGQLKSRLGELNTLTLVDKKNASVGTIDIEIEIKQPAQASQPQNSSPQRTSTTTKHVIGTVIVKPVSGKFDTSSGINDNQKLFLILTHGDISYQSATSEGSGRRPNFQDVFSFQQFDNEELIVRVFDNDPRKEDMIAEGQINLKEVSRRGSIVQGHIVTLTDVHRKTLGELSVDLEFSTDVVNNPIKAFPLVSIRRGESIAKKIKYDNPDKIRKTLRIKSDNPHLIFVKTDTITVNPGDFVEIRFKFLAPANSSRNPEDTCRIDITVEETRTVEESLLFKLKAI